MRRNEQIYSKNMPAVPNTRNWRITGSGIGGQRHKTHAVRALVINPGYITSATPHAKAAAALRVLYKHPAIQVREEIDGVGHGQGHHQRDHGHCDVIEREAEQAIQAQSRQDRHQNTDAPGTTAARCGKCPDRQPHAEKGQRTELDDIGIMDLARLTLVIGQPATWKVWPPAWYCARTPDRLDQPLRYPASVGRL